MTIFIKDLEFQTIIGILDFEREKEQKIIIDLEISYPYKKDEFLNYADVATHITDLFQKKKFFLLEDALEISFETLKKTYPQIDSIEMKITKPDILDNGKVGVKSNISFKNL